MSDDLRDRVARAIADVREGGWPADTYTILQQHYLIMADAAIAAMGQVEVKPLGWAKPLPSSNPSHSPSIAWTPFGLYYANEHVFWLGNEEATKCQGIEAAKAAAQADYERRIRAALKGQDQ